MKKKTSRGLKAEAEEDAAQGVQAAQGVPKVNDLFDICLA